jgi:hypothetical protein
MLDTIKTMQDGGFPPFLVVRATGTGNFGPGGANATLGTLLWGDHGTGGWDWSMVQSTFDIEHAVTKEKNYICVGHAAQWHDGDAWASSSWYYKIMYGPWLYAHKSICRNIPCRGIMSLKYPAEQTIYQANVAVGENETPSLYYPLGFFGTNSCIGVARAFMKATPWTSRAFDVWENWGPVYFVNQGSRGGTIFMNTLMTSSNGNLTTNYEICINATEALDNWLDCIMQKALFINGVFQGFTVEQTRQRDENRTFNVMKAY